MNISLSDRVQSIKPSPTLAVTAKAAELKAAGQDIIGLGAGEPDFDTPDHIKKAAIEAIQSGQTRYTAVGGTTSLKKAIIAKLKRDNQLSYKPDQILVSNGAKHSIYNLMQALLSPGDEVIIPAPYWVSYPDMTLLAEAKPVIINTDIKQHFKITPEQLEKAISPKTRLILINSPSNPTGKAYTRKELAALGTVILKHPKIIILSDDIYEHILWTKEPYSNIVTACPELYEQTVVINGVSKAYAMTGWRIGYAAGHGTLIKAMTKIQGQSTSNPCSISQAAAEAALNGDHQCVKHMLVAFKKRHDFVVDKLNQIPGVECIASDGAFYAFPKVEQLIHVSKTINSDSELAEYLISKAGIALVPGSAFGANNYLRLSFATSLDVLKEALKRFEIAAKNIMSG